MVEEGLADEVEQRVVVALRALALPVAAHGAVPGSADLLAALPFGQVIDQAEVVALLKV